MFGDKRFETKNADLLGTILLWLIVVGIPALLIIHGSYLTFFSGDIVFGIVELFFGCVIAGFWLWQIAKSKKSQKLVLEIIENGVCRECTILEYSKEKDEMDFCECVVVQSEEKVYIFGVNALDVPKCFPVGSTNKMFIRNKDGHEDILITNKEVDELHTTIDNKLIVTPHILDKYAKKYNCNQKTSR